VENIKLQIWAMYGCLVAGQILWVRT